MGESIGKLIVKARERREWDQKELVRQSGYTQSAISDIERGAKDVSRPLAITLNRILGIPIEMLLEEIPVSEDFLNSVNTLPPSSPPPPASVVIRASSLKNIKDLPEKHTGLVEVPVASGAVAAGPGRYIEDDKIEDWAWIPASQLHGRSRGNLACVRVDGDSMEPVIMTGAMICVDRSEKPGSKGHPKDAIYAVLHGGKVSVKYIQFVDHIMALLSANISCPPMLVDLRENPSPVIGRVVWVWQAI